MHTARQHVPLPDSSVCEPEKSSSPTGGASSCRCCACSNRLSKAFTDCLSVVTRHAARGAQPPAGTVPVKSRCRLPCSSYWRACSHMNWHLHPNRQQHLLRQPPCRCYKRTICTVERNAIVAHFQVLSCPDIYCPRDGWQHLCTGTS